MKKRIKFINPVNPSILQILIQTLSFYQSLSAHPSKTIVLVQQTVLYLIESAFLLKEQKKSLAKENSPAGEKLPEIISQWQQKFQLLVRQKIAAELVRQEIFALAIAQNFLPAIFHRRDCFCL